MSRAKAGLTALARKLRQPLLTAAGCRHQLGSGVSDDVAQQFELLGRCPANAEQSAAC